MRKPTPVASSLSRRVVLKVASALTLASCSEKELSLLVDDLNPYPLDREGDDEMPRSDYDQLYDPLLLYARTEVSPGASAGPNVAALVNPHGTPMELLAVRFRIYPKNTSNNFFNAITGMGIGVKMDVGSVPIVDAGVPLNAFGSVRDDDDFEGASTIFTNQASSIIAIPTSYLWRLRYPLLLSTGCTVTPVFTHFGQNHFPVVIDTTYICRSMPANFTPPQTVRVPWVGSYNSVSFDNLASQAATTDLSSELDIVNPFRQPLELSRIIGRCSAVTNGLSSRGINIESAMVHRFQYTRVKARARAGDEIVRSPTVFNGLFPFGWRAWDIPQGWALAPGEFYKVQLNVEATDATAPSANQLGSIQFSLAATGFRQLPLSVYATAAKGDA